MQDDTDKSRAIGNGDRVSAIALLALGIYLLYESAQMRFGTITSPGPGFFPVFLSVLLIFAASVVLLKSHLPQVEKTEVRFDGRAGAIIVTLLAIGAYAFVLETIGFLLATFIIVVGLMIGIGRVPWLRALIFAAGGTVLIYAAFISLGIPLPTGIWFE